MAAIHFTVSPTFPYFPIKPEASIQLDTGITSPPWNAIGYTVLVFYPLVIGLTFLLSLDVSFSCWFFYLFTKVENVGATAFGFRDPGAGQALARIPYVSEQGVGAFVGLALFSLWLARPHLKATLRRAFLNDRTVDDSDEPLSYRTAWVGMLAVGGAADRVRRGTGAVPAGLRAVLRPVFFAGADVHAHPGGGGPAVGAGAVGPVARHADGPGGDAVVLGAGADGLFVPALVRRRLALPGAAGGT